MLIRYPFRDPPENQRYGKKESVNRQNLTKELISRGEKPPTGFSYIELHRVQRNFIIFYRIYVFELARFVKIWVPDVMSSRKLRNESDLLDSTLLYPSSNLATIAPRPTKFRQEMNEKSVLL